MRSAVQVRLAKNIGQQAQTQGIACQAAPVGTMMFQEQRGLHGGSFGTKSSNAVFGTFKNVKDML